MIWTDSESSETAILLIGTSEVVVEVSSTLVVEGLVVVEVSSTNAVSYTHLTLPTICSV